MAKKEYHLVWHENFTKSPADSDDWNVEIRPSEAKNSELQAYVDSPNNMYIRNNMLFISPTRELNDKGEFEYASTLLSTKGLHEFQYGRFEARMKVPYSSGFIPFFKLVSDREKYGSWPACGQIDIMQIPTRTPGKHYATIHYLNKNGNTINTNPDKGTMEQGAYTFEEGLNAADTFHDYVCEWEPGRISFEVDGEVFFESNIDEPLNHPMYFQIGMAIGGTLAGPPTMTTVFSEESSFIIDYIRVSQKEHYEPVVKTENRKLVALCGSWEDAENFNIFLRSMLTPEFSEKYVLAAYTFGVLGDSEERVDEHKFVEFVGRSNPSAMIIFAQMVRSDEVVDRLVELANSKNIPVFMFDKPHKNCINVPNDFQRYFEDVCRHIIEYHGIHNVEFFAGTKGNEFSDLRENIFRLVLSENNIRFTPNMVHYGDFWDQGASKVVSNLLKSGYKVPDAYICANDAMALGVEKTLRKFGYKIPEDVKIIGFDGIRETSVHNPGISTCAPDYAPFVNYFLDFMETGKRSDFKIGGKLNYRQSCGCERCESEEEFSELVSNVAHDITDNFRHMYEMSSFVRSSVRYDNFFDALEGLEKFLWLWKDQYYFVGLEGADEKLRVLYSSYGNIYKRDHRYINLNTTLPDMDMILSVNSGFNALFFKQVKVHSDDFVFAATAMKKADLRTEQRFEELALFMTTVLESVYNNQTYERMHREVERISQIDPLTGLYNRRGFIHELEKRISKNKKKTLVLSLFSVDMDGLKYINDTFGHSAGDTAIQIMAETLSQYAGSKGICARYGGDEFAFALLSQDTYPLNIEQVHLSLDEIIRDNPKSHNQPFKVSASIGYSQRLVDDDFSFDAVVREADKFMYDDKKKRKGN